VNGEVVKGKVLTILPTIFCLTMVREQAHHCYGEDSPLQLILQVAYFVLHSIHLRNSRKILITCLTLQV
jgi:hypothetical protein